MAGRPSKAVIAALKFEVGVADASAQQPDQCESVAAFGARRVLAHLHAPVLQVNCQHAVSV
jgi:hypothetical protein